VLRPVPQPAGKLAHAAAHAVDALGLVEHPRGSREAQPEQEAQVKAQPGQTAAVSMDVPSQDSAAGIVKKSSP
jgi:hypothetical protein